MGAVQCNEWSGCGECSECSERSAVRCSGCCSTPQPPEPQPESHSEPQRTLPHTSTRLMQFLHPPPRPHPSQTQQPQACMHHIPDPSYPSHSAPPTPSHPTSPGALWDAILHMASVWFLRARAALSMMPDSWKEVHLVQPQRPCACALTQAVPKLTQASPATYRPCCGPTYPSDPTDRAGPCSLPTRATTYASNPPTVQPRWCAAR